MPDHALNVATQEGRQRSTVTRHHCIEASEQSFPNPLAAEPNAVQREQALDPPDNASPLLNQVLALALNPLGIFGWFYGRTSRFGDAHTMKGPYSTERSVALMIARELIKEILKRDSQHRLPA